MRKTITLFLIISLSLCFCGCENKRKTNNANNSQNTVVEIKEPTDETVNGYRVTEKSANDSSNSTAFSGVYCANTNSKKFHKSTCGSASAIKEENLYVSNDRNELISKGYSPCSRCNP